MMLFFSGETFSMKGFILIFLLHGGENAPTFVKTSANISTAKPWMIFIPEHCWPIRTTTRSRTGVITSLSCDFTETIIACFFVGTSARSSLHYQRQHLVCESSNLYLLFHSAQRRRYVALPSHCLYSVVGLSCPDDHDHFGGWKRPSPPF